MAHTLRLPWPAPWEDMFGREGSLFAEIGFGNGRTLLALARQQPDINLIGLEISLPALRKAAARLERKAVTNVRLVQGSGLAFLWALCAPQSLSGLIINFPDPWPKANHHHRRLINDRFLELAATRLRAGATLDIATDHVAYAEVITTCLQNTPCFDSRLDDPFVTEDLQRVRTKYETKALAAGHHCHYFKWQRNDQPAWGVFPAPQEIPMPHVVFHAPLTLDEVVARFQPRYETTASAEIKFIEIYRSAHHEELLIETYVSEEPQSQRVGLSLRVRRTGDWVLGLHEFGFPRPTAGVHQALGAMAAWLSSLHPDFQIQHSTLADSQN